MRRFEIEIPVELDASGMVEVDGVIFALTEMDVFDLNEGLSITTLTTQGEEVALFPAE